ncbi:toll/interleukin-1 receptor domain-containing protein [Sphingomonas sp. GlSt437]|uniref:toll/interleukin-1 receptor domain-containing protein n=1 Tax=Sphingomonas sp. GlSt437 TaxID=3389970 RepID=UPI003A837655
MTHKIFLSHNHNDKPLVEAVAIRLAGIFGKEQVFYDSWSIRPGDGIIDQMNKGLEAPEFVFFFVSKASLESDMVKLEWQNALYAASKGKTRIIPVRVDGSAMPPILMQTLYIDMHTVGLEAAIAQIVSITQGDASFTPQHLGFSNLSFSASAGPDGAIDIVLRASHLMEPNVKFVALVNNPEVEVGWETPGVSMNISGYNAGVRLDNGIVTNGIFLQPSGAALTPAHPVRLRLTQKSAAPIDFLGLLHERGENNWVSVPLASR